MAPSSTVRHEPLESRTASATGTPAAGRPATASSMWVETVTSEERSPPAVGNHAQLRGSHGPFDIGIVLQPFPQRRQHLIPGETGGANEEDVTEAILVLGVADRELRPGGIGHTGLLGRRLAARPMADPRVRVHCLQHVGPGQRLKDRVNGGDRSVGRRNGRPAAIARANRRDAQQPSIAETAPSAGAALNAASVN